MLLAEFDALVAALRSLTTLPLPVIAVQGVGSVFRYADVFPPAPLAGGPWRPAIECIVQLEASGKWPDDLSTIGHVRTAFIVRIARLLKEKHNITSVATASYLDVSWKDLVFRLFIHVVSKNSS